MAERATVALALDVAYWGEYDALMESLLKGEKLALERWGRGVSPHSQSEIIAMKQLRMELEAKWIGFD